MPPDFTACTLPVHCVKQIGEICLETVQELLTKAESPAASVKKQPLPKSRESTLIPTLFHKTLTRKETFHHADKMDGESSPANIRHSGSGSEIQGSDGLLLRRRSGSYADSSWAPSSAVQHCPCCLQQDGFAEVPWGKGRSTTDSNTWLCKRHALSEQHFFSWR